jgi:hypothetical protein
MNVGCNAGTAFLSGGGAISQLLQEFGWADTPLGAIGTWDASLKTTLGLILRSPVPMVALLGEQGT